MPYPMGKTSFRTIFLTVAVFAVAVTILFFGADGEPTTAKSLAVNTESASPNAVFPANAGTLGGIVDGGGACSPSPGTARDVTFTVSGVSGTVGEVAIDMTFGSPNHTFVGDIVALLIAPNGATHNIFGRTGATTATSFGDSSDLSGLYAFTDAASSPPSGGWWQAAGAAGAAVIITPGTYRTTAIGGAGATNPQPATSMNPAFSGVTANGTWTLRLTDGCSGDTGAVTAANLTVNPVVVGDAPHDVTGDGRSDFLNVRADGAPLGELMGVNDFTGKDKVGNAARRGESAVPQVGIGWWVANNNQTPIARYDFGQDTDFFLDGDFDLDGRDDLVVWSPGAATVANFKVLRSSDFTVQQYFYGQTGDDPTMAGDWNGDGRADLAVYRDGTAGSPQSFFFWSDVSTPTAVNYIVWGTDGDVAFSLDYDGDGRLDAAVQRNGGGGRGDFYIRQSSNGALAYFIYGLSSDFVMPGDYDGDGRDDITVSRNANFGPGTFKYFWIRESDGGGTPNSPFQWGIPGDFITPGDYDGDGRTDIAVWRSNADPNLNFYFARRSSDGGLQQFEWGQSGDYPVNNWNVH